MSLPRVTELDTLQKACPSRARNRGRRCWGVANATPATGGTATRRGAEHVGRCCLAFSDWSAHADPVSCFDPFSRDDDTCGPDPA